MLCLTLKKTEGVFFCSSLVEGGHHKPRHGLTNQALDTSSLANEGSPSNMHGKNGYNRGDDGKCDFLC